MAWFFGAGFATDAFVTAFRIPNLLRDMFAEGALSSSFVPVFKEKLIKEGEKPAFALANIVLVAILLVVGLVVVLGIIAAPVIIYLSAHGFVETPEKFDLTVNMTRIMMVYLLLVSLSALVMGMLNSLGKFGVPALSPAMFNFGVVLAVIFLYEYFEQPAYTLAIGVVIGGVGQLAVQLPALWRLGYRFRPRFDLLDDGLKRVVRLLAPMIVGLSAGRINVLVNTLIASFMMEGAISYLSYSYRLMHFPLGVFAVALGTVTLPRVSELVSRGDLEGQRRAFDEAINLNLLVLLPSAAFLAMMGRETVDLIYHWGAFDQIDAANTTLALRHYAYGLIGWGAVRVVVPFYYAHGDSKLPMKLSVVAVVVNLLLYYPMIKALGFAGLAAASSTAGILNLVLALYFLPTKGIPISWGRLGLKTLRMGLAAVLAFYLALLLPWDIAGSSSEVVNRLLGLVLPMLAAGVFYVILCLIFQVKEVSMLARLIFRRGQSEG
jgi:putative peptidoglycan lipid II flippase